MLLEFSCSNHKSIKNKITFSTIASSDNTFEETLKPFANNKVVRSSVIYGANGSGKTNFLNAISFMQTIIIESIQYQPGQEIPQVPHKLSTANTPSEYYMQFVKDGTRYAYSFSIKNHKVYNEYLYYFPNGKQVKIFERQYMHIKPGDKYKHSFDNAIKVLKENRLFFSCAANFTDIKEIETAFLFFAKDVVIYNPQINNWKEYSINLMKQNEDIKQLFIKILQSMGTGINDVKAQIDSVKITESNLPENFPDVLKNVLISKEAQLIDTKVVYKLFETDLMSEESTGIQKLFEIICPIIDIIQNEKILVCDEFETGLHESLAYFIIKLFHNSSKDNFAQFLFSTHNTNLLSSNLFRRDQIWFTELNNERSTDLYSLIEIKNVRKTDNIEKGYLQGKYGAIPILNYNFLIDKNN